ncbi:hypothetical protein RhiirA5_499056 [Rhizophagus irregularis]|uniref:Uncharacterized protein n=1 Tax=Rhizophagus irregularis TaxID=588596 RepID=A0A2N0PS64_9GLOM|nr:hypothetical protein RhiirA5_499056 [Rhizophagus irregularis]
MSKIKNIQIVRFESDLKKLRRSSIHYSSYRVQGRTWTWTSERLGRLEFQKETPAWNSISAWAIKGTPFQIWISAWAIKVTPFLDLDFGLDY